MFKKIFSENKKVLIPFIMAGVPSLDESYSLALSMIEEGASMLELGVPFSDPSADGEVLQRATEIALKNNVTLIDVLSLARRIHQAHPQVPIVLFTYLNPLIAFGLENYVKLASDSGISATLTVDLPIEEAEAYVSIHGAHQLGTVFLASPTTSQKRLKLIDESCTAFLYYVSRSGVTGARSSVSLTLEKEMVSVRETTKSPVAIGFGVSNPEQAKHFSLYGDAVVIGSAYMSLIMEGTNEEERKSEVRKLTRECVKAIE